MTVRTFHCNRCSYVNPDPEITFLHMAQKHLRSIPVRPQPASGTSPFVRRFLAAAAAHEGLHRGAA
jgi:hypothetical protein